MKSIPKIITIFALIGIGAIMGIVANEGLKRSEVVECYKLQDNASHLLGFYVTQWEKDMCDAHGITIDAPVSLPD